MNNNLTDITVVIDRSGSMASCREDAEGGLNSFIESQAKLPGDANLTLVQFDTEYDFVHRGTPIKQVPKYHLEPRGMTALYDAVGRAINETGLRLATITEAERPGLVAFAIVTDGEENSSREFSGEQVKAMIDHQAGVYSWKFTYLGANQDAMLAAGKLGIAPGATMNYATKHSRRAFDNMAAGFARQRSAAAACAPMDMEYTADERRTSMEGDDGDA